MKFFLTTLFFSIITLQLFSQTEHDTSKVLSNKKIMQPDKKLFSTKSNSLDKERLNGVEIQSKYFEIPLSFKIYQKIFADEEFYGSGFSQEYLNSGLSNNELRTFDRNKSLTKRMLYEIYGEDIIDLKKILEDLGITKDQIIMIAAILKFFLYSPFL